MNAQFIRLIGFLAALGIILAATVHAYLSSRQLLELFARVDHTQAVINKIRQLQASLVDAETGQRGFVLTGEDPFLDPYRAARGTAPEDLTELRRMTADNTRQQDRQDRLETLVSKRFAQLQAAIEAHGTREAAPQQEVEPFRRGKAVMDELRGVLDAMIVEEDTRYQLRKEAVERGGRRTALILLVSVLLSGTLLAAIFGFMQREARRRQRSEAALQELNRELDERVQSRTSELRALNELLEQRVEERTAELREAKELAEAAGRAKSEFLATMSHEIRTPMTGVLGMADLLAEADLPEKEKGYVETIRTSGRHLLSIINDILDFSRIEAGRLELEQVDFSIAEVLEQVRSLTAPQAHERGLELNFEFDEHSPPIVRGDPTRLKQVLLNLVGNGLKFTSRGGVAVHISTRRQGEKRACLRFEVRDTGIGIQKDIQAGLFSAFVQAEGSTTRRYGGTGLGLAISRRLVEAMGGTIGVESVQGVGSLFWFEASFEIGDAVVAADRRAFDPASVPPLRILLAEDVVPNQMVIAGMLRRYGHAVVVVDNGAEAVEQAALGRFDLILMDVQMPGMDGVEATRRIRRLDSPARETPIIALTANVMAREQDRYLSAGMEACLTKPVIWSDLLAALAAVAARSRPSAAPISGIGVQAEVSKADEEREDLLLDRVTLESARTYLPAEKFERLLGEVIDEAEQIGARLGAPFANAEELANELHRVKGAAGIYGLRKVSAIAQDVEVAIREHREVPELVSGLRTAVAATRVQLLEKGLLPA